MTRTWCVIELQKRVLLSDPNNYCNETSGHLIQSLFKYNKTSVSKSVHTRKTMTNLQYSQMNVKFWDIKIHTWKSIRQLSTFREEKRAEKVSNYHNPAKFAEVNPDSIVFFFFLTVFSSSFAQKWRNSPSISLIIIHAIKTISIG